ncbi:LytR family transcriptional regulator [Cohnella sp. CFH 77786]|uniref:LCP family protein n=1 Tax=Cohnella sp. CFH 77786 TaxID=2662265 RepID=UPI001C6107E5|nr:LCP family protein [Cohnella sp. CFH 77786]MBW5444853.1 LytR family transcriptional regulator [Cohnella sp. CFH 77786]
MSNDHSLPPRKGKRQADHSPKAAPPRKPRRLGRIVFGFLALVIIALASYAGYLYYKADRNLDKVANPTASSVPKGQLADTKPIGMLVLGLDTRAESGGLNTDVMMAAVFNPKSKTATVVSIPRDSDLGLEGYKKQKANAFYAGFLTYARNKEHLEGDEARQYAKDHMKEMMQTFFDVPIDYTVMLDFQGFVDVVDALGGVDVYVDQDMRYWDKADGTNIDLKKGEQTLKGEDALGFVRYRKSRNNITAPSSDFERNDRQDRVLGAILDKLKSFGSVAKLGGVMDAVGDNMKTDIPRDQINNMISTYFGITKKDVRFIALTGEWKSPYVYLDQAKLEEAKAALKEELLPEGRPSAPMATQPASESPDNG